VRTSIYTRRIEGTTQGKFTIIHGSEGKMAVNPDFRDLLSTFNAHGVDYLVVGAHALAAQAKRIE